MFRAARLVENVWSRLQQCCSSYPLLLGTWADSGKSGPSSKRFIVINACRRACVAVLDPSIETVSMTMQVSVLSDRNH